MEQKQERTTLSLSQRQEGENRADLSVEMIGITKRFGSFTANDNIHLQVKRGEIHAILGENGAGKSTLMNVLYGLYQPTEGEIRINGKSVSFQSPNEAIAAGIGMVHQHFMLVQPFTVAENIILGEEPLKGLRQVDRQGAMQALQALSEQYNLTVALDAKVSDITVGMQQRVEILKVLYRGAEILILDEPTASLTPQEIEELISILRNLVQMGKSILLITHKLKEIKAVADRCTIIRRGKYIQTVDVASTSEAELATMMVGRTVNFAVEKQQRAPEAPILEIRDLHVQDYRGIEAVCGLNLTVCGGEIVGLAGVDGNGQSQLVEALCGIRDVQSGSIHLCGKEITHASPRERFETGLSCIPEDRQKYGLVLDYSVADNLILQNYTQPRFSRRGILKPAEKAHFADRMCAEFDIRPSDCKDHPAGSLSGGNQQKVIIAREVTNDKELLIAFNPTRGLDVGAIEFVHRYLVEQRNKGKAILLVSFELDEILSLSDRIEVVYRGNISGSFSGTEVSDTQLGLMMAGGQADA